METVLAATIMTIGLTLGFVFSTARRYPEVLAFERDPTYLPLAVSFSAVLGITAGELITLPPRSWSWWMGVAWGVVVAAMLWSRWAKRTLGENFQPTAFQDNPAQEMVRTGPYRWMRHPIYAGNTLYLAGILTATGVKWAWLAMPLYLATLWRRIRREEAELRARFPEA